MLASEWWQRELNEGMDLRGNDEVKFLLLDCYTLYTRNYLIINSDLSFFTFLLYSKSQGGDSDHICFVHTLF